MSGKTVLPQLFELPPQNSFWQDLKLLLKNQIRVNLNSFRQRRKRSILGLVVILLLFLILLVSVGSLMYGVLAKVPPQSAQVFLALIFMVGLSGQIFFGITAAFAALYMSDDLELLFMTPVCLKVVFLVKSTSVLTSNFAVVLLFAFLPGVYCGLLFQASVFYYLLVLLAGCGLWLIGTALAELLNLFVMRIVPRHRSKEAIGFIGALTGILMAMVFQLPNILINSRDNMDISTWLAGKNQMLEVMNFFPWGWASQALIQGLTGSPLVGLGWSVLILGFSILLFLLAMALLERGFKQGFISLSEGEGGRRRKIKTGKTRECSINTQGSNTEYSSGAAHTRSLGSISFTRSQSLADNIPQATLISGIWSVAKKDLLTLKRDTREWFGYVAPLLIMAFFIAQYFFLSSKGSSASLIMVLVMYTVMFSGNMALQSFGREGESDWLLNSVPMAGGAVVYGKLLGAVLPTLLLMEILLVGTSIALGVSASLILLMALSAVLLSLGSSAIGLYYSIHNCRYNPDNPHTRISPSASLVMYLINLLYLLLLGLSLCYLFPPEELVSAIQSLPGITYEGGFQSTLIYALYLLTRPLLWAQVYRIILGVVLTAGVWALIFFGFMAGTVLQSKKGFKVEYVTNRKIKRKVNN